MSRRKCPRTAANENHSEMMYFNVIANLAFIKGLALATSQNCNDYIY